MKRFLLSSFAFFYVLNCNAESPVNTFGIVLRLIRYNAIDLDTILLDGSPVDIANSLNRHHDTEIIMEPHIYAAAINTGSLYSDGKAMRIGLEQHRKCFRRTLGCTVNKHNHRFGITAGPVTKIVFYLFERSDIAMVRYCHHITVADTEKIHYRVKDVVNRVRPQIKDKPVIFVSFGKFFFQNFTRKSSYVETSDIVNLLPRFLVKKSPQGRPRRINVPGYVNGNVISLTITDDRYGPGRILAKHKEISGKSLM